MEWERGETPPGRVMSNLKTGGLRDLLEALIAGEPTPGRDGGGEALPADAETPSPEAWTPVV